MPPGYPIRRCDRCRLLGCCIAGICMGCLRMIRDNRLNRWVEEEIGTKEYIDEDEFFRYDRVEKYRDHELFMDRVDTIVEQLEADPNTRRAIVTTDRKTDCMVGIQVLLREKIHVICWLRSSDRTEKRHDDIGFLIKFAESVREQLNVSNPIRIHLFTSSLHWEVDHD